MRRILPGFLLVLLVILSFSRNGVLRSDDTVGEDVILRSPRMVRAHNELGRPTDISFDTPALLL